MENEKIILTIIHGAEEHKDRYDNFIKFLNERNIEAYTGDLVTHGENLNKKRVHNFTYKEMEKSALEIIDAAKAKYPGYKNIIFGHSMGSFIVKDIVYSNKRTFDGMILSGTSNPKGSDLFLTNLFFKTGNVNKVNKFNNFLAFGLLNVKSKHKGYGKNWLSTDPANEKSYKNDEKCGNPFTNNSLIAMFKFISNGQNKKVLTNFEAKNIPQLVIYGEKDPVSTFGNDIKRMINVQKELKITNQKVISYPNSKHEILFDVEHQKVEQDIIAFLNQFKSF